jgi:phage baseplate assembly protein W
MPNRYYQLPLRLDQVIRKQHLAVCNMKDSIAQNLHLIIGTYRGESAYSPDFGCSVWDEEFNITLNPRWKENLFESLRKAVSLFEKRLQITDIKAYLEEKSERSAKDRLSIRRSLRIEISGIIRKTNEQFNFRDQIYISPLAQQ